MAHVKLFSFEGRIEIRGRLNGTNLKRRGEEGETETKGNNSLSRSIFEWTNHGVVLVRCLSM